MKHLLIHNPVLTNRQVTRESKELLRMHYHCLRRRGRASAGNLLQTLGMRSVEHNPAASDPKTLKLWHRVREIYRVVWGQDLSKRAKGNGQTISGQT